MCHLGPQVIRDSIVEENNRAKERLLRGRKLGACKCGHTRDEEKNCDGTHKVVKAVREQIAQEIEIQHRANVYLGGVCDSLCTCLNAAAIARGQK